jgi:glutathione S-transferase
MTPIVLHYASGSPYAWRVWLALEHKGIAYERKLLSFDAGDLETPAFTALNPRRRVPVIEDGGFVLYESAAILEYLEDTRPSMPNLFAADARERAVQRRMIREADAYVAPLGEHFAEAVLDPPAGAAGDERIAATADALRKELAAWEGAAAGTYLSGALSAVDLTFYPMVALATRIAGRKPALAPLAGPKLAAWAGRMAALDLVRRTWPPHWR